MKIAFRADASTDQGTGHVMRTLTLAKEFRLLGHETVLHASIQNIQWLSNTVKNSGISYINCLKDKIDTESITSFGFDLLVVDSYLINLLDISKARKNIPIAAIVDATTRGISADYLIDHNLGARWLNCEPATKQLIGPKYALVRKEIRDLRRTSCQPISSTVLPRVLVMMGGSDPTSAVLKMAHLVSDLDTSYKFIFVTTESIKLEIEQQLPKNNFLIEILTPNLSSILATIDVAISAAGTSVLDLSCIGIPTIFVSVAENQNTSLRAVSDLEVGLILDLEIGRSQVKNDLQNLLHICTWDDSVRTKLFQNSQRLVDGFGASRVVEEITRDFS